MTDGPARVLPPTFLVFPYMQLPPLPLHFPVVLQGLTTHFFHDWFMIIPISIRNILLFSSAVTVVIQLLCIVTLPPCFPSRTVSVLQSSLCSLRRVRRELADCSGVSPEQGRRNSASSSEQFTRGVVQMPADLSETRKRQRLTGLYSCPRSDTGQKRTKKGDSVCAASCGP